MVVSLGSNEQCTSVKKKTLAPVWDESFEFKVESVDDALVFDVYDADVIGDDEKMGQVAPT